MHARTAASVLDSQIDRPMDRVDTPPDLEHLLALGLEHYGRREIAEAITCWRRVLAIDPTHAGARDYLEAAGADPERGIPSGTRHAGQVIHIETARAQRGEGNDGKRGRAVDAPERSVHPDGPAAQRELEQLLANRRFEEALTHLYAARSRHPNTASISRGIRLVREKLISMYAQKLGSLDVVPRRTARAAAEVDCDSLQVLPLVDGISSFEDILASCTLGRWAALRTLCQLRERGALTCAPEIRPMPALVPASSRRPSTPPNDYEVRFQAATRAYLARDYDLAVRLFEECVAMNPADTRARYNLQALQRRKRS